MQTHNLQASTTSDVVEKMWSQRNAAINYKKNLKNLTTVNILTDLRNRPRFLRMGLFKKERFGKSPSNFDIHKKNSKHEYCYLEKYKTLIPADM